MTGAGAPVGGIRAVTPVVAGVTIVIVARPVVAVVGVIVVSIGRIVSAVTSAVIGSRVQGIVSTGTEQQNWHQGGQEKDGGLHAHGKWIVRDLHFERALAETIERAGKWG